MSRSRQGVRAQSGGWRPMRRVTRTGRSGVASSVVLVVVVVAFALALSLQQRGHLGQVGSASSTTTSSTPAATAHMGKPLAGCRSAGQPACTVDPGWINLPSDSPAAVAQTIASSSGYGMMTDHFGGAGLDMPALVHAYPLHTGIEYLDDDHWIVTAHNASGLEVGIYDFIYDRARHQIRACPQMPMKMALRQRDALSGSAW